jgi:hypothetical protein
VSVLTYAEKLLLMLERASIFVLYT